MDIRALVLWGVNAAAWTAIVWHMPPGTPIFVFALMAATIVTGILIGYIAQENIYQEGGTK